MQFIKLRRTLEIFRDFTVRTDNPLFPFQHLGCWLTASKVVKRVEAPTESTNVSVLSLSAYPTSVHRDVIPHFIKPIDYLFPCCHILIS